MTVSNEPIVCIDKLLEQNLKHSNEYKSLSMERRRYRVEHPTEIAALLCMDGRLNLPIMTQTAPGIIQTFRNLGGKFDIGWPLFQSNIDGWVQYAISRGRKCVIFVTYHYARGDAHRGCKGFGYDTSAARNAAFKLQEKFDYIYGKGAVTAIVCGIETDLDALILHGEDNGVSVDLSTIKETTDFDLTELLRSLYPTLSSAVVSDLLPLIRGNVRHIAELLAMNRSIQEVEHKEWVLAVGRGFDWLRMSNTAFMVGPFDPDLAGAIGTAAKLLEANIADGRIDPKNGIILMTASAYRDTAGPEHHLVREKALYLSAFALDVVKREAPSLCPYLQILTGITDLNTREFSVIERVDCKPA